MEMENVAVLILAGGRGSRFWPLSRPTYPKPFLTIFGERSLLQATYDRVTRAFPSAPVFVVTETRFVAHVQKQLPELPEWAILVEPVGRDTAACIGWAVLQLERRLGGDPVLVTLPSDHFVGDDAAFSAALQEAVRVAAGGDRIVTLGVRPIRPETGYGYLFAQPEEREGMAYRVRRFIEKPPLERARRMMRMEHCYWNCGIYVWKRSVAWANLVIHLPDVAQRLAALAAQSGGGADDGDEAFREGYAQLPAVSIDFGVAEKAENLFVLPVSFPWDDVGNWNALSRIVPVDKAGNVVRGPFHGLDVKDCIVVCRKPLAAIGVENLVLVETDEAVLVCSRDHVQRIKSFLQETGLGGEP